MIAPARLLRFVRSYIVTPLAALAVLLLLPLLLVAVLLHAIYTSRAPGRDDGEDQ